MGKKKIEADDSYSEEEAGRRRDEVIRRMANTPPQPRVRNPSRQANKIKKVINSDQASLSTVDNDQEP